MSLIVPILSEKIGNSAVFLFFGTLSLASLLYLYIFLKDTTYAEEASSVKGKQKRLLTNREKKELYMPQEFKSSNQNG